MGDLALALHVGYYLGKRDRGEAVPDKVDEGYPFTHVKPRLKRADVLVGNLECVVSAKGVKSTDHNPLRAPLSAIKVVKDAGVSVVSIANNHTSDFGTIALDDMKARLGAEKLPFFGGNSYNNGPEEPWITESHGIKIGILGFYLRPHEDAVSDVKRARPKVDVLIAYNHWGRDDTSEPIGWQKTLGHKLIDAGVDMVIGTHTHVLQPEEWYKGKLIFYGLGNFVFSGMNFDEAHQTGGYLEVDIGPKGLLDRRFYRTKLDGVGAPHWLDESPTDPKRLPESERPNL